MAWNDEGNSVEGNGAGDRMTTCPDCGAPISKLAEICPQCGRPMKAKEEKPIHVEVKKEPNPFGIFIGIILIICGLYEMWQFLIR